jgi:YteA family regulatory protein
MDKYKLEQYKQKLIREKTKVKDVLNLMERNQTINVTSEMSSELSFYDNHPADSATELYDKEKGMALKADEISVINKIDDALKNIENGEYGVCKMCGKVIEEQRLQFIPFTDHCASCQNVISKRVVDEAAQRPVEEDVLGFPFGFGYNDFKDDVEFDAEDSYQCVGSFNSRENIVEDDILDSEDGYVEDIERISNEQYLNQLPD